MDKGKSFHTKCAQQKKAFNHTMWHCCSSISHHLRQEFASVSLQAALP